ncbi:GNAT family N-acetyltransferase [Reinekea sp.]|uniref:GNAT family N-acetyltransferase n=1 Tax=Reinekea sp. TaxID=1970455 RepID=UPI002A83EBE1|nr:GNAT family N-acetyltransferase [Reinekea sp.]
MTYSLLLDTPRLTLVGTDDISLVQLSDYFQGNYRHLLQSGGFIPTTGTQVRALLDNWQILIGRDTEVRLFIILDEKIIGIIGSSNIARSAFQAAFLGYNIAQAEQGKGYMTEALTVALELAFGPLNLHRLMANYRPANIASGRVLEKLGFVREGFASDYLMVNGRWEDHILTALTNRHWSPQQS